MAGEGALTLAKGRRKIAVFAEADKPTDWGEITDVAAWIDATCGLARDGFALGYQASDTTDDAPLCAVSNRPALDADNFSMAADVYRYLVAEDGSFGTDDELWSLFKSKGTEIWVAERLEPVPLASVPWTTGDKGIAFPFITDNPQWPSDLTGYLKRHVEPLPNGDPVEFTIGTLA